MRPLPSAFSRTVNRHGCIREASGVQTLNENKMMEGNKFQSRKCIGQLRLHSTKQVRARGQTRQWNGWITCGLESRAVERKLSKDDTAWLGMLGSAVL